MTSFDRIPTGRPLTAREFLSVLDPTAAPYIPELHDDDEDEDRYAAGELAELRHTVLDLDPDSAYSMPGATCPACPPRDLPEPNACRWCGLPRMWPAHGLQYYAPVGLHSWEPPTQEQIKARMLARRKARLAARPVKYHAATSQAPDETGEAPIDYCADCGTTGCRKWMRIQDRRDRRRIELAGINPKRRSRKAGGGWGGGEPWPF